MKYIGNQEKSYDFFFNINFPQDEKIFFVRIFFKPQELAHSFPTHPTRASRSVCGRWDMKKKAVTSPSGYLSNHRLQFSDQFNLYFQ